MKIKITQSKISNLYSFISNLSQWNKLVCVPQRKKEWLQKTGKLNKKEKEALKKFSQIFQKAKFNLEKIFLYENPKKIWQILAKKIGKTNAFNIQSIFKILEGRFNKIWKSENKKLKKIAKEFSQRKSEIKANLEIIRKLCGLQKTLPQKIELRLLLSSNKKKNARDGHLKKLLF